MRRKKKFPFGKLLLVIVIAAVLGGGFYLSREQRAKVEAVETPVELKLQPLQ